MKSVWVIKGVIMSDIKYIFKPCNKIDGKEEFSLPSTLLDYIKKYDFFRQYDAKGKVYGVARAEDKAFYLSASIKVKLNDFDIFTQVGIGQYPNENFKFYIGEKVERIPNSNKIKVTVFKFPKHIQDDLYEEYTINYNNCVIDNKTLKQIYPPCDDNDSRLNQFINMVQSIKGNLGKVK